MNPKHSLKVFMVAALGAIAMLTLPAIATAKHHSRSEKRHGHHGRRHHRLDSTPAGTIRSFDPATGKLVITLTGEETIGGLVTEETEIECGGDHHGMASASDAGEEHGSPADEEGEGEPGDDHGDHGEEGEDHHGEGGEPGDDDGPGGEGEAPSCTTADLTEGATVKEAELKLESGSATFEKVELAG
jgi:hypothetical protein